MLYFEFLSVHKTCNCTEFLFAAVANFPFEKVLSFLSRFFCNYFWKCYFFLLFLHAILFNLTGGKSRGNKGCLS